LWPSQWALWGRGYSTAADEAAEGAREETSGSRSAEGTLAAAGAEADSLKEADSLQEADSLREAEAAGLRPWERVEDPSQLSDR
jgi:hypothetical protein